MRARTYDRVLRFAGRWYGARGEEFPVYLTYLSWISGLLLILPLWLAVKIVTPFSSNLGTFFIAVLLDVVLTSEIRKQVDADRGVRGIAELAWHNVRTFHAAHRAAAQYERDARPVSLTTRKIRVPGED